MFFSALLIITWISFSQGQANENVIRQARPLPSVSFDEIKIDGVFDVFLSQVEGRSNPSVEIETTADTQKQVLVEMIDNHILFVHMQGPVAVQNNVKAFIRFASPLRRYTVAGTGNTVTDDNGISNRDDDRFVLENRGTANVALQLNVNEFEANLSGTGNSRLWGQVRELAIIKAKGVGDVNALNLPAKEVIVIASGVSTVRVAATGDARIEVTGVSTVYYRLPAGKRPSKAVSTGLGQIVSLA